MGHRNALALAVHPGTGAIWENENGPNGGDEINILQAGKNYGWPVVSFGRFYAGPRVTHWVISGHLNWAFPTVYRGCDRVEPAFLVSILRDVFAQLDLPFPPDRDAVTESRLVQ